MNVVEPECSQNCVTKEEKLAEAVKCLKRKILQEVFFKRLHLDDNTVESQEARRYALIEAIEKIVLGVVESVAKGCPPVLQVRNQKKWTNVAYSDRLKLKHEASYVSVKYSNARSRPKFALIVHLMSKIHQMLTSRSSCTKRELYYQTVSLIGGQPLVDNALKEICCMLDAGPWELGVMATSKGLVAGPITFITDADIVDCMSPGGVLVPQNIVDVSLESSALFLLVVEKDATFQKLLDEEMLDRLGPCLLVTGKGFPDINTRILVRRVWEELEIPIFVLVDADPHGIDIMCVYRFGSLAMSHKSDQLAVPAARWIGIHPSELEELRFPKDSLQQLTVTDLDKLRDLSNRPYMSSNPRLEREINILHHKNKKAEIEALSKFSRSYLTDAYIRNKICCPEVI